MTEDQLSIGKIVVTRTFGTQRVIPDHQREEQLYVHGVKHSTHFVTFAEKSQVPLHHLVRYIGPEETHKLLASQAADSSQQKFVI